VLSIDGLTERKNAENYTKTLNIPISQAYFVKTPEQWKETFLKLQKEVDMIIIVNYVDLEGWDKQAIIDFGEQNIRIPIGASLPWVMPFAVLGVTRLPEEQGTWAAQTALQILNGTKPADIPITQNKDGRIHINLRLGNKLNILFSKALLKTAEIIR
jgi:ABC-type uncharacterized transport system substrate-binding protein